MVNFKKLLFGNSEKPLPELSDDIREDLDAWRSQAPTQADQSHFHTRYVVVDVATSGLDSDRDVVLGLAGLGLGQGGVIVPDDAFALDLPASRSFQSDLLARQLVIFLQFAGHGPVVTYQAPFVGAFLGRLMQEQLGVDFEPEWIDLAWLLPDLFKEKIDRLVPMDDWLAAFGIEVPGRRDALADSVAISRLLQVALPRAMQRGADTPGKLVDIGRARRWLRPSG